MRIHPVFHKKLLEPAPPDAELATDVELEDDEYEVEEIKDLRKDGRQWKYLVKWQGWPESHNTWELEQNLTNCKELVQEYHREHPKQQGLNPRRGRSNQKKDQEGHAQPVTSPNQPKVRIAVVRRQEGPYQGSAPLGLLCRLLLKIQYGKVATSKGSLPAFYLKKLTTQTRRLSSGKSLTLLCLSYL
ncbi:hypothetical protein P3342_001716 [Pyrenophora teres f. teres]|nr:hypothetical protein P3342_001716 [Pyrenophora teres f. teres]